ncbi:MAG: sulfate-transporting ATPase [Colwellia sp.]|jgi:ATP-binding cassette ChvD family protein|uniref:energy-dependent translational throttle protein EttA n=1 Tax=unclassified Colwellia TaxID=196834 RepID=UPI000879121C|nr:MULTISPECIES: energy-dependent translational throttle protein EttA [unclassified Colwellia]MBA6363709.1 energy-dependent translational throttle protein EttA [Colwellia sp. BRX8-8]AOW77885.1 energy-dependent translational throttle protein EttA [Colwellia sp. PAMC 20917]MBA6253469.1 energy-dependent translational throttle protein EttA [Colwellia sp. MB3u-55]MBA6337311.1 energy-dependent translational throttle protein EttA [Colwellia sp. BRX8-7]MBA6347624.1 energy-dependent translational throt|tara:strand:+ start:306 stop:1985 length:1680 start_codon:yes stop_codon:yes gene_type:complete
MAQPLPDKFIMSMNRVSKVVPPKRTILKDISLSFFPGVKIGVLGLNGSGKSTLLRIMAGVDKDFEGEATSLAGTKIGYLPQEPQLDESQTVREAVEEGVAEVKNAMARLDQVYNEYAEEGADFDALAKEQGDLEDIINAQDGHNLDNVLERAADALRLPEWDQKIAVLSGGERRRVALCRLLLEKPDMLLLDEPTNHLDAESVAWLERFLHDYPGTVVAITHDRYFLDNVAGWILELDRGHGIPYEGNYSSWLEQKDARLAQESKGESALQKTIKQELEWVRSNPKARQSKSKARMARFEELNSQDHQKRNETNELYIPPGPRLGDKVLDVNNLTKSFGDRVLIDDLSFSVPKGAIVGIIGPNGAGKSTLFKIMSGAEKPDSGNVELGDTVKLASVDQFRDDMDNSKTVYQEISQGHEILQIGNFEIPSRAYVSRFNFKGNDQQKIIGELSGGERNRVHLAKLVQTGGNVLLLDEPTNDLDVETLRALEEALLEFPGCAMVISHDRWFLDRIATHILDYRDEGKINFYEGNFTDYEAWLKKTLGPAATEPHRIRYKKIG